MYPLTNSVSISFILKIGTGWQNAIQGWFPGSTDGNDGHFLEIWHAARRVVQKKWKNVFWNLQGTEPASKAVNRSVRKQRDLRASGGGAIHQELQMGPSEILNGQISESLGSKNLSNPKNCRW